MFGQTIMAITYYITAVIYFLCGLYAVSCNFKSTDKFIYILGNFSFSACSLFLVRFFLAPSQGSAIFLAGILGFFTLLSGAIFLHFTVLLSLCNSIIIKKIIVPAIYVCSILFWPFFYLVHNKDSSTFTRVVNSGNFGWQLNSVLTIGKICYLLIILFCLIMPFILMLRRYKSTFLIEQRRYYQVFFVLLAISFFAFVAEQVSRFVFNYDFPTLSIIILSLLSLYRVFVYSKNNYHVSSEILSADYMDNIYVVDLHQKATIYKYISYMMIILSTLGNAINIFFIKDNGGNFGFVLYFCIFVGAVVIIIQSRFLQNSLTDFISNVLWAITIPILLFGSTSNSAIIFWVIPIVFALVACIFIERTFIILFSISGIISCILLFLVNPHNVIIFSYREHIIRILILITILCIILAIHKFFVKRLQQIRRHEFFQMAVVDISQWLVLSQDMEIGDRMDGALKSIMEFTGSDRVFVYRFSKERSLMNLFKMCCKDDSLEIRLPRSVKMYEMSDKIKYLFQDNVIIFNQEKEKEYQFLQFDSVCTVYIPMSHKNTIIGMLCLQSLKNQKFSPTDKQLFKILANMLSNALMTTEKDKILEHNSIYDILTQLPNRAYFTDLLNYRIEQLDDEQSLTIVFIDLDAFQQINDAMGHDYGDRILVEMADRLTRVLGNSCVVSRFGGDEFLILFNESIAKTEVELALEIVMEQLSEPIFIAGNEMHLTISAGVAIYPQDGKDSQTLLKHADMAMNEAKSAGRNRYVFCSEQMKKNTTRKAVLLNHLRRALVNSEFKLVFQPQVASTTHKIRSAEALLRWFPKDKPDIGNFVSPGEFIPLLEETGLIIDVGRFVIEETVRVISRFQKMGVDDIMIALNLSVEQFKDLGVAKFLDSQVQKYGIDSKLIDIEVTESAYSDENKNVDFIMNEFFKLGVSVSIDDFGTGYSNMSRLTHINIDKIKIDMSYVSGIGVSKKDEGIVMTIINLAKSLDCITVAEGVETKEQLEFLREKGCELIQGYYFYKPMPEEDFIELIKKEFNIS